MIQHNADVIETPVITKDSSPQTLAARVQSPFSSPLLIFVVSSMPFLLWYLRRGRRMNFVVQI